VLPVSRPATTAEIPIIDLHGLSFAGESDKREIAQAVAEACREAGFFYIVNHGVEPAAIADMFAAARTFFDLPLEKKEEVSLKSSGNRFRGYLPSFHKGDDPNLKETFRRPTRSIPNCRRTIRTFSPGCLCMDRTRFPVRCPISSHACSPIRGNSSSWDEGSCA
jgi:hypothetical protein